MVGTEKMKEPYRVIIAGSSSFHNYQLLRYICDFYLSEKLKTHAVILLVGTSSQTEELVVKYAEERSIFVDHFAANWDKYGQQNAVYQSYEKQLSKANALIAFWDGKSTYTGELIKLAKSFAVFLIWNNFEYIWCYHSNLLYFYKSLKNPILGEYFP